MDIHIDIDILVNYIIDKNYDCITIIIRARLIRIIVCYFSKIIYINI